MNNPWDEIKEEQFSDEDRQKIRYFIQLAERREPMFVRISQVYKAWWMLPIGILIAVSGAATSLVDFVIKGVGVGQ